VWAITNSRIDARPKARTKKIAVPTPFGVSVSTFLPVLITWSFSSQDERKHFQIFIQYNADVKVSKYF
jgi:hypothetical protein